MHPVVIHIRNYTSNIIKVKLASVIRYRFKIIGAGSGDIYITLPYKCKYIIPLRRPYGDIYV